MRICALRNLLIDHAKAFEQSTAVSSNNQALFLPLAYFKDSVYSCGIGCDKTAPHSQTATRLGFLCTGGNTPSMHCCLTRRIVVVGRQSVGKSSMLQDMAKNTITLPTGPGIVTRSPLRLSLRKNDEFKAIMSVSHYLRRQMWCSFLSWTNKLWW